MSFQSSITSSQQLWVVLHVAVQADLHSEFFKLHAADWFSEGVSNHLLGLAVFQTDAPSFKLLTNEMALCVDVFASA